MQVDQGNAWVPTGASAWEIGTDNKPLNKAKEEYAKRTKAPGSISPKTSVFVFVTPRKWEGKVKWRNDKCKERKWRDVRVYDSDDLEQWLETAPAVDAWLARLRGKLPLGVWDLSSFWEALASTTEPPLQRGIFLAGREKAKEDLERALVGPAAEVPVHALSLNELRQFLAAVLTNEDAELADMASARALIVETREAWRQLAATKHRLTLIAGDQLTPDKTMIAEAVMEGHRVITQTSYTSLRSAAGIRLPRVFRWELQTALETAGFNHDRAHRLARESGGSTSILVRIASRFAGQQKPAWTAPTEAAPLLPLVLVGSWNDGNQDDRRLIEKLSGKGYDEIQTLAIKWLNQTDAPLQLVNGIYSFVAREDSWRLLSPLISGDQLESFEKAAKDVLEEHDPRFEMPAEERYAADLYKKLPALSPHLREGIAETVALLGVHGEHTPHWSSEGSSWRAARVVRTLLHGAAAERWFSLSHFLPLLAEAAPDEFLTAVEADLASSTPALAALFGTGSPSFFSSSPHVGLMWALQHLAWESSHLTQVSLALAELTGLDGGGRNHPRPAGVLHGIYRFWYPETAATINERLEAFDLIIVRHPDLAWTLLKSLVLQGHDTASPGSKPRWRDYDDSKNQAITYGDIFRQVRWAADRLIQIAAEDTAKWQALAGDFDRLPDVLRDAVIAWFESDNSLFVDLANRAQMWKVVRNLVQKHRFYHDAPWALPPEKIDRLAAIKMKLAPADPLIKHGWLFGNGIHDAFGDMETPYPDREKMAADARSTALREIFEGQGFDGVMKLAVSTPSASLLGTLIAKSGLMPDWHQILPHGLSPSDTTLHSFAIGYAGSRLASEGEMFLHSLPLESWTPESVAEFALAMPFNRASWELLRERQPMAEPIYWKRVRPYAGQMADGELEEGVRHLLEHGRAGIAIDALSSAIHSARKPDSKLVADVLEAASLVSDESDLGVNLEHYIWEMGEVMKYPQSTPQNNREQLARIEWRLLPLARHHGFSPESLHKELATNPAFFLEVLTSLFTPDDEPREEGRVLNPSETRLAKAAFQLMESWADIPGTRPDGSVDAGVLMKWVEEARRICASNKRLSSCDSGIGRILAFSPMGADGVWPCEAVREVLEKTVSEALLREFVASIYNKRGVVTKSITEGGEQERELSAKYTFWTSKCKMKWPRTARTLRRVAERYDTEARHEDERVESLE